MKRKGLVQGILIAMAAFLIAALTVLMVYNYLSRTKLPPATEQVVNGDKKAVSFKLGQLIDYCWEKNNYGQNNLDDDCFLVTINSSENVSLSDIKNQISYENVKANFKGIDLPANEPLKLKVIYHGKEGFIEIKGFLGI